jgi:hypothetical protein
VFHTPHEAAPGPCTPPLGILCTHRAFIPAACCVERRSVFACHGARWALEGWPGGQNAAGRLRGRRQPVRVRGAYFQPALLRQGCHASCCSRCRNRFGWGGCCSHVGRGAAGITIALHRTRRITRNKYSRALYTFTKQILTPVHIPLLVATFTAWPRRQLVGGFTPASAS